MLLLIKSVDFRGVVQSCKPVQQAPYHGRRRGF